jgi:WD40 repeat protein
VVSITSSPDGANILSGHVDGSIYLYSFNQATKVFAVAWKRGKSKLKTREREKQQKQIPIK